MVRHPLYATVDEKSRGELRPWHPEATGVYVPAGRGYPTAPWSLTWLRR